MIELNKKEISVVSGSIVDSDFDFFLDFNIVPDYSCILIVAVVFIPISVAVFYRYLRSGSNGSYVDSKG